jgi:hypothetical protein
MGCYKKEIKAEAPAKLSVEPSGYFWLNLMPVVPAEGPSFHAIFKLKATNTGSVAVKNVKAMSATIYAVSEEEETELGTMELKASPNTPVENEILPGEQNTLEFSGTFTGANRVIPDMTVYANVFLVWDGGQVRVLTPQDKVVATR